jgi:deoxyribodipyrimidine photolyase
MKIYHLATLVKPTPSCFWQKINKRPQHSELTAPYIKQLIWKCFATKRIRRLASLELRTAWPDELVKKSPET